MKKFTQIINSIEKAILVYPFLLLGCLIVFEVLSRKLMGFGLSWLQELGRYIMVYGTFLGASIAVSDRSHPAMTAIYNKLKPVPKAVVSLLRNLMCGIVLAVVAYYSWIQFFNYIRIGTLTSSLWGLPMYIFFVPVPICLTTMAIRYFIECGLEPREVLAQRNTLTEEEEKV